MIDGLLSITDNKYVKKGIYLWNQVVSKHVINFV